MNSSGWMKKETVLLQSISMLSVFVLWYYVRMYLSLKKVQNGLKCAMSWFALLFIWKHLA